MGSSVSNWGIVNGEHYELFTGHEMTEQSAESAAHRSQQGEENVFGVDTQQPPLPTANVTQPLQGKEDFSPPHSLQVLSELCPKAKDEMVSRSQYQQENTHA